MKLMVFSNVANYKRFFSSLRKNLLDVVEYRVFRNYSKNKMLILAEHALTERIAAPQYGKGAYMGIGDKNTDILAKMAAFFTESAYLIPWISRYQIDFARDPKDLGKGDKVLAVVYNSKKVKKKYIAIHNNKDCLPLLMKYKNLIKELNPKFILSYHGMDKRHVADISIGAGPDFAYLGGKDKARGFVDYLKASVNERLKELGFKLPLDVRLSTIFLGHTNHTLATYTKKGVVGCQVEFNLRGRTSEKLGMPKRKFQIAAQLIPQCMQEFYGK